MPVASVVTRRTPCLQETLFGDQIRAGWILSDLRFPLRQIRWRPVQCVVLWGAENCAFLRWHNVCACPCVLALHKREW